MCMERVAGVKYLFAFFLAGGDFQIRGGAIVARR